MGNDIDILRANTVLCRVSGSAYGLTRVDRLTKARAVQDGSLPADAKVVVPTTSSLLDVHNGLVAAQVEARNALRAYTIPYGDNDVWYVLPHAMLRTFVQKFAAAKAKFNSQLNMLTIATQPVMVTQGQAFEETRVALESDEIAKARAMLNAYQLSYHIQDYPSGEFPGLYEKAAATLCERLVQELARVVAAAKREPLSRLAEPVLHAHERLTQHVAYMDSGSDKKLKVSLRSSIFTNVGIACDVSEAFNFYDDEHVRETIVLARAFSELDMEQVRSRLSTAREVLQSADLIRQRIEGVVNNQFQSLVG